MTIIVKDYRQRAYRMNVGLESVAWLESYLAQYNLELIEWSA